MEEGGEHQKVAAQGCEAPTHIPERKRRDPKGFRGDAHMRVCHTKRWSEKGIGKGGAGGAEKQKNERKSKPRKPSCTDTGLGDAGGTEKGLEEVQKQGRKQTVTTTVIKGRVSGKNCEGDRTKKKGPKATGGRRGKQTNALD